jgi:L-ascorbate metabolism protein UlaG (beta-lactamase superfamily)
MEAVSPNRITWLGHATVLLELSGVRLITDPVLRPRVLHLRRQGPAPEVPGQLDAVLLSHLHYDHLDLPSLRRLDAGAILVVPRGGARSVRRLRHELVELAAGEELAIGQARVRAVPAIHDGRRMPVGSGAEAIGFVVESGPRVYFAGDTEQFDAMAELAPLDVALLPVWGWGPSLGPGHMDPEEAAAAAALLRPSVAIPIHWGTFRRVALRRAEEGVLDEPPRRFKARCAALTPKTRVEVLLPGQALALPAS